MGELPPLIETQFFSVIPRGHWLDPTGLKITSIERVTCETFVPMPVMAVPVFRLKRRASVFLRLSSNLLFETRATRGALATPVARTRYHCWLFLSKGRPAVSIVTQLFTLLFPS